MSSVCESTRSVYFSTSIFCRWLKECPPRRTPYFCQCHTDVLSPLGTKHTYSDRSSQSLAFNTQTPAGARSCAIRPPNIFGPQFPGSHYSRRPDVCTSPFRTNPCNSPKGVRQAVILQSAATADAGRCPPCTQSMYGY